MGDEKETARRLAGRSFQTNVDRDSIEIDGIDMRDYPDFCDAFVSFARWDDGQEMTDEEIEEFSENEGHELVNELIHDKQLYI